jgi:hypothetical protein
MFLKLDHHAFFEVAPLRFGFFAVFVCINTANDDALGVTAELHLISLIGLRGRRGMTARRYGLRRPVIVFLRHPGWGVIKPMPEAKIAKAVQLLDLMLEHFADDSNWTRGRYDAGNGGLWLVGALLHLSRKHRLPTAPAIALLQDAMPRPGLPLVHFNDRRCGSIAELRTPRGSRARRAVRPDGPRAIEPVRDPGISEQAEFFYSRARARASKKSRAPLGCSTPPIGSRHGWLETGRTNRSTSRKRIPRSRSVGRAATASRDRHSFTSIRTPAGSPPSSATRPIS